MSSFKIPADKIENAKLLFENIKKRRAVRDIKKDDVPDELIHKVLEAASYAPSPENYEPWRFI
ncbi:MAG: nitroreductase family protein, partial [Candidatus Helarchaeota archaeon]|nr:nitroreductase family protein [Candidatus Helarchaeota archaeon]